MTLVEAIYRGQNWRLRLRGLEWNKTGLLTSLQMFGTQASPSPPIAAIATVSPQLDNIGDRWTKYCQALLLTAILANPPSVPSTLTATNAGIAPNSTSEMMFTSKMREIPLEFVLIPYNAGSSSSPLYVPFTTT